MTTKRRLIQVEELRWGCSACDWIFNPRGSQKLIPMGEKPEDARKREFNEHVCTSYPPTKEKTREDFSQAAARIVREATEKT